MSTVKNNKKIINQLRFAKIANTGENIFHGNDLANLWGIIDKNLLYTTLKRYTQKELLYRICRGLYSIKPLEKLDPLVLGIKSLHDFSYISAEIILARAGIIFQDIKAITLISSLSKNFTIGEWQFRSRKLKDIFLFNPAGVIKKDGILIATPERAIADMLYFNPKFHFDNEKIINWKKVKAIQKEIGYIK